MKYEIAEILKDYVSQLDWADTVAGLVSPVVVEGKTIPVYHSSDFIDLIPNSDKRSVTYFESSGDSAVVERTSRRQRMDIGLRLVCWYNIKAINDDMSESDIVISLMNVLPQKIRNNGNIIAATIEVGSIAAGSQVFSQYSYNEERQFLVYPYGGVGINLLINAWVGRNCADSINIIDEVC